MEKIHHIGISCIGSGVGQSVINSCRLSKLPVKTFGLGTNPMAYGLYDCDEYVFTPNIYESNYVDALINICQERKIELVIPGMDDEAYIFAQQKKKFDEAGIKVIVAGEDLLRICRDKEKMSTELNRIADVFVKSYDKNGFVTALEAGEIDFPVIAKPRSGFASRGIEIILSKDDLTRINETHIVQELAVPHAGDPDRKAYEQQLKKRINPQFSEISIQVVADAQGAIIGKMISYNKLNNGVPIEILPLENDDSWHEIDNLVRYFQKIGLKGPLNLQGRITDKGLKLFEMNARFTGITGLRAYMGFNEVEACIKSWLSLSTEINQLVFNQHRFGIRQTADKSIDMDRSADVRHLFEKINNRKPRVNKVLLITGATGYLGRNLIRELTKQAEPFSIWALVRNKQKAAEIFPNGIVVYDNQDLITGNLSMGNVDIVLHAGFARPHCSPDEIADSLSFTGELFRRAVSNQVPYIINISSQSVYGQGSAPPWAEDAVISPDTSYGSAKFATEILLGNLAAQHKHIVYTSIRLAALSGGAEGLVEVDFLSRLVAKALKSEKIHIVGGMQVMERLDVRDAVNALRKLLNTRGNWQKVYNLGSAVPAKLADIAELVVRTVSEERGVKGSEIEIERKEINMAFGLDNQRFCKDFNWKPDCSLKDSVKSLIIFHESKKSV